MHVDLIIFQNKQRFVEGEHNLDLTYVTKHVIATSFPSEGMMAYYRNKISDVAKFLDFLFLKAALTLVHCKNLETWRKVDEVARFLAAVSPPAIRHISTDQDHTIRVKLNGADTKQCHLWMLRQIIFVALIFWVVAFCVFFARGALQLSSIHDTADCSFRVFKALLDCLFVAWFAMSCIGVFQAILNRDTDIKWTFLPDQ